MRTLTFVVRVGLYFLVAFFVFTLFLHFYSLKPNHVESSTVVVTKPTDPWPLTSSSSMGSPSTTPPPARTKPSPTATSLVGTTRLHTPAAAPGNQAFTDSPTTTLPKPSILPGYEWLRRDGYSSMHILFSTSCTPFTKWQTQLLIHSHRKWGYPGRLTEVMGCNDSNWQHLKSDYPAYTLVRTPNYDHFSNGEPYAPRNKPQGLAYLVKNFPEMIKDDELVIIIDPDMLFIAPWPDLHVTRGNPAASGYSTGLGWLKLAPQFCGGTKRCSLDSIPEKYKNHLEIGAPYILHPDDFRSLMPSYAEVMEEIGRSDEAKREWGWIIEMFAYDIGALRLGLYHTRVPMMISYPGDFREPWDKIRPHPLPPLSPTCILHYCQPIKIAGFKYQWYKHSHHRVDFMDCSMKNWTFSTCPPSLCDPLLEDLKKLPSITPSSSLPRNKAIELGHAWLYWNLIPFANEAFGAYYDSFCEVHLQNAR